MTTPAPQADLDELPRAHVKRIIKTKLVELMPAASASSIKFHASSSSLQPCPLPAYSSVQHTSFSAVRVACLWLRAVVLLSFPESYAFSVRQRIAWHERRRAEANSHRKPTTLVSDGAQILTVLLPLFPLCFRSQQRLGTRRSARSSSPRKLSRRDPNSRLLLRPDLPARHQRSHLMRISPVTFRTFPRSLYASSYALSPPSRRSPLNHSRSQHKPSFVVPHPHPHRRSASARKSSSITSPQTQTTSATSPSARPSPPTTSSAPSRKRSSTNSSSRCGRPSRRIAARRRRRRRPGRNARRTGSPAQRRAARTQARKRAEGCGYISPR